MLSWIRNLKLGTKLTLLVTLMAGPIAIMVVLLIQETNIAVTLAQSELIGTEYLKPVIKLQDAVTRHRDAMSEAVTGSAEARGLLESIATRVASDLASVETADRTLGQGWGTAPAIADLKAKWEALRARGTELTAAESVTRHTEISRGIEALARVVGDKSGLILDPDLDTYHVMEALVVRLPALFENLSVVREGALASVSADIVQGNVSRIERELSYLRRNFQVAKENNPGFTATLAATEEAAFRSGKDFLNGAVTFATEPAAADGAPAPGTPLRDTGNAALDRFLALYESGTVALTNGLNARFARLRSRQYSWAGMGVVSLVITGVLSFWITGTVRRPVADMMALFTRVGKGDFKARVTVTTTEELGTLAGSLNGMLDNTMGLMQSRDERDQIQRSIQKLLNEVGGAAQGDLRSEAEVTTDVTGAIADSFNFMIGELRKVIGEVQSATTHVRRSASELQTTTQQLATGSDAQASQILDTSGAIEEMAASIAQVSTNAASSAAVAEQARTNAEQGARAVSRTIEGMKAIREQVQETSKRIKRLGESSQEVGEIVQLIGDVADRTSILALNASIQAAMAGEAGRGFAVVAEEVERLAERATDATKRIATLIKTTQAETAEAVAAMEDTTREVVNGSALANEAGTALGEIQGVSNRLAELIQAISDASQQQARSSEHVSRSMQEISQITRQTASGSKHAADSIGGLANLVETLNRSMARFKLPSNHGVGDGIAAVR